MSHSQRETAPTAREEPNAPVDAAGLVDPDLEANGDVGGDTGVK